MWDKERREVKIQEEREHNTPCVVQDYWAATQRTMSDLYPLLPRRLLSSPQLLPSPLLLSFLLCLVRTLLWPQRRSSFA